MAARIRVANVRVESSAMVQAPGVPSGHGIELPGRPAKKRAKPATTWLHHPATANRALAAKGTGHNRASAAVPARVTGVTTTADRTFAGSA